MIKETNTRTRGLHANAGESQYAQFKNIKKFFGMDCEIMAFITQKISR